MNDERATIVVLGAGDHAKIVLATIEAQGEYSILGLIDNNIEKQGHDWYGLPVLGGIERLSDLRAQGASHAVVAVGDNTARAALAEKAVQAGLALATVIHPRAIIIRGAVIGEGSVILADAHVGADCSLGIDVLISVRGLVAHDCIVGDHCQVGPGATLAGHVRVGDHALIGMGASVLPGVSVGRNAMVGANAAVIRDVPAGHTVAGVPARRISGS